MEHPLILFIGLNPSTADETKNDPTIRRCINFAKDWGYGGVMIANLFAFRSTSPEIMKQQKEITDMRGLIKKRKEKKLRQKLSLKQKIKY